MRHYFTITDPGLSITAYRSDVDTLASLTVADIDADIETTVHVDDQDEESVSDALLHAFDLLGIARTALDADALATEVLAKHALA